MLNKDLMKFYETMLSGNCYKVRLLMTQLAVECERIEVDPSKNKQATDTFRMLVPLGRVPALEVKGCEVLVGAAAILCYLAEGTRFLPVAPMARAQVIQWITWGQQECDPNIAVPRPWFRAPKHMRHEVEERRRRGRTALKVLEAHLQRCSFIVDETYGVVDIAIYAYVHLAPLCGQPLSGYPAIESWLRRVREQEGYIPFEISLEKSIRPDLHFNPVTISSLGRSSMPGMPSMGGRSLIASCDSGQSRTCIPQEI